MRTILSTLIALIAVMSSHAQQQINVAVNGHNLTATLADNSSAAALAELLQNGSIDISAHDYGGFEKVGELPQSLPANDERITTTPGDIILYLGSNICFYYGTNTWTFTRLGRIDNAESLDLQAIFGSGDAVFTLSLTQSSGTDAVQSQPGSTLVYALDGTLVATTLAGLAHGLYLVRQTLADGTVRSRKIKI